MKILLIGNLPEDRQESMQRFCTMLELGLSQRGHEVITLKPTLRLGSLLNTYRYNGLPKYLGYVDKFLLFPRALQKFIKRFQPEVTHILDHANAVYRQSIRSQACLATLHDLLQIKAACGLGQGPKLNTSGQLYQKWIRRNLNKLPLAVCVSEKTREDALLVTQLTAANLPVVPNALHYPYRALAKEECRCRAEVVVYTHTQNKGHFPTGYLLNVGGGQWYKNRPGLLRIYAHLRDLLPCCPKLLLVGKSLKEEERSLASALDLSESLRLLSNVSNSELETLYSGAEGLLFPSLDEGFGWPIAEAQACACPVFTSNRPPMNVVGGKSSVYFDPTRPEKAAKVIMDAWPTRFERAALGLTEAKRWCLETMLKAYEDLYTQLLRKV